jgi:molybdate transport system permease protein
MQPAQGAGRAFTVLLALAAGVALTFLALPLVALFTQVPLRDVPSLLRDPAVRDAIAVTLRTNAIANVLIVAVGTPVGYLLATRRFRGRAIAVTLVELPLVLPPAVAGIGLLAALGPNGILGGALQDAGIQLVLQTAGVVVALTFVSAPYYIRQAQSAFAAVERPLLDASRTLGSGEAATFARVAVPVALPGLAAGLALAWGRALGEFGATLMFAGSFRGVTQTVPLAIYDQFTSDFPAALALSAVLVAVSAALLLAVKFVPGATTLGGATS